MLIVCGSILPGIIEIFYFIGLSPYGLDLLPFAISLMAVCYYIAIFRYDFIELQEMIQKFIFSESSEGVIILDQQKRLIRFNKAAQRVYDFLNYKNIGKKLCVFDQSMNLINNRDYLFEIMVKKDTDRYYEIRYIEMKGKNNTLGSIYLMKEITQQKEMIKQLDNLASYDSLTQIYNRRRFMEEAKNEFERNRRYNGGFSILMIDIDYFKEINDVYGHTVGDEIIRMVAQGCKDRIRMTDIIGRYGGDEFCILLSHADKENAMKIAEQIRDHIEDMKFEYLNQSIKVTVSIGITTVVNANNEEFNINFLLSQADQALYRAKQSGRNLVYT
jgi:diguanylate cyclase (GGDEF)-like protein